jgi:hypothetical protein
MEKISKAEVKEQSPWYVKQFVILRDRNASGDINWTLERIKTEYKSVSYRKIKRGFIKCRSQANNKQTPWLKSATKLYRSRSPGSIPGPTRFSDNTVRNLLACWWGYPLWHECGSEVWGLASAVFLGCESDRTHDPILLSQVWDSPQCGGPGRPPPPTKEEGRPVIPAGTGFLAFPSQHQDRLADWYSIVTLFFFFLLEAYSSWSFALIPFVWYFDIAFWSFPKSRWCPHCHWIIWSDKTWCSIAAQCDERVTPLRYLAVLRGSKKSRMRTKTPSTTTLIFPPFRHYSPREKK